MKKEIFERQIEITSESIKALNQLASTLPDPDQKLIGDTLEELSTTMEELRVADEELRQQNEEWVATRQAIEVERHRYRELFDFAPDGYLITDTNGVILEANRAAGTLLSVSQDFLKNKPFAVFVTEEDKKPFYIELGHLNVLQRLEDWEVNLQPRDGKPFPAAITITQFRNPEGSLVGLRWLIRDTTEQRKRQELITHLASFPELNPNPVIEVDLTGRVHYMNSAATKLLPDLQPVGIDHPWLTDLKELAAMLASQEKDSFIRELKWGGNWYEQRIYSVMERKWLRIYALDITARKQMEGELRKSRDDLEIRVRDRSAELTKISEELAEQSRILEGSFTSTITPLVFLDRDFNFIRVNEAYAKSCKRDLSEFSGHNHFEFYPDEENEAIFRRVVETKVPYQAIAKPFSFPDHPEWGVTYWDWTLTPLLDDNGEVEFLVFSLEDVTDRKEAENRLHATNALLNLFAKKSSRKEYLDAVLDLVLNRSKCRCGGIRVLDERACIPYESCVGFSREFWESENWLSIVRDQCACTRVVTGNPDPHDVSMITSSGSFRCNNTIEFVNELSEDGKIRFRGVCVQNGFLSVAVIPVRHQGKPLGAIHLADEREGMVPPKMIEFIESMAPLIGEAVNRFNLEEENRESENRLRHLSSQLLTVQENERKRIARDIHDSLGASLAAIKYGVEAVFFQMAPKTKKAGKPVQSLETIIGRIQETIEEVRRIQMDLRPPTLDDLGIVPTIGWFIREFQKIYSDIRIEKEIDLEEGEVPDPLKTVIYRVMQEALNNIAKHSKAEVVRLALRKRKDRIELMIEDNGAGFDSQAMLSVKSPVKGFGLSSMRERTELSGGVFAIDSSMGAGTTIQASWPIL